MSTLAERDSQKIVGTYGEALIGADDSNNDASTSNVVGNLDGSVVERLEAMQGGLPASYSPKFGYLVTKVGDISAAPDALFDATGLNLVTLMVGEVTSVLATSSSLSLNTSTNDQVIAASTTITSDALATLYIVSGDPDLALNGGGTPGVDIATLTNGALAPFVINDDQIEQNVNSAGTGTIKWSLWYWPIEASASIAAAS